MIDGVSQVTRTELLHGCFAGGADRGASGPLRAISKWTVCLGLASPICILPSICPPLLPTTAHWTHATEPSLDLQTKGSGPSKGKLYIFF